MDRTLAVNVRAVFVATQAAVKHMQAGGRIINIASCNAERVPIAGQSVYSMSKAALSDFAKLLLEKVMALFRYATVDEIASLVAYLAGPEAAYVTGVSLSIDGGFTA